MEYNKIYTYEQLSIILPQHIIELLNRSRIYSLSSVPLNRNSIKYNNIFINTYDTLSQFIDVAPSHIIGNIYLGKLEHVLNNTYNFKYIINLSCYTYPLMFNKDVKCLNIYIYDSPNENIAKYFIKTNEFIEESIRNNKKIIIHCRAGISRSTTIVIAYLMFKYKLPLNDLINYVRLKRPIINPNIGFIKQLKLYEQQLFNKFS